MTRQLELQNIQGLVLRGYHLPCTSYVLLRVTDAERSRTWLGGLAPEVVTAAPWASKPSGTVNVAVSFAGLESLGVPDTVLRTFPIEFREGMEARAPLLGDDGDSGPEHWESAFLARSAHVLLIIGARDGDVLERQQKRLLERAAAAGLVLVGRHLGVALPRGMEHFGFVDGIGQPLIEGSAVPDRAGRGAWSDGAWRPVRAGEFILGYHDEEGLVPPAPRPDSFSRNGSYLVFRKIYQDVAAFRRQLAYGARLFPGGEELLAAKLVGRWRDGTPLALSPDHPAPDMAADANRNNAFSYANDPLGARCPIGSHIRRANPRDSLPFGGALVNRHRIVRRCSPYGPPLPTDSDDDELDRGLLFVAFQASISRQFEFVQSQWLNDGNIFGLSNDHDVIAGSQGHPGTRKMTIPGSPPYFFGPLSQVFRVCGGEYFFCPGINGLLQLSSLFHSPPLRRHA